MNPGLARLQPYPFQRLAALTQGITPAAKPPIVMSIGEPKHAAPPFVQQALCQNLRELSIYPATKGTAALRAATAAWATQRFKLDKIPLDPGRHVLPCAGTREALFSIAQTVVDNRADPPAVVMMPNPFYQIYEGAALLAGAQPHYLNTTADTGYKIDFSAIPADLYRRTRLVYVCSPGNPTGAVLQKNDYRQLLELAERFDFVIASDECYSEIYFDEQAPPLGLLQVANELGIDDYRRCVVFHSLSKRSSLPGLRSGFIAGDGALLAELLRFRTYHGCSLSGTVQQASIAAWNDEHHVRANRVLYREKFTAVLEILGPVLPVQRPQGGFYLWPRTPIDDERFTRELFQQENVLVLPGSYLSRETAGINPGHKHLRLALVGGLEECKQAAQRLREFIHRL